MYSWGPNPCLQAPLPTSRARQKLPLEAWTHWSPRLRYRYRWRRIDGFPLRQPRLRGSPCPDFRWWIGPGPCPGFRSRRYMYQRMSQYRPRRYTSVDDTCAVMVMTVPLVGLSGVTNRDVVVALDAHAAGTAVTNARALNNSGINRLKDTCREIRRRLTATWVECVIGSELRSERSIE